MQYRVVEIKWDRGGDFYGTPPIVHEQPLLTDALNGFAAEGWLVTNIHHEVGDSLRFSIITLVRA